MSHKGNKQKFITVSVKNSPHRKNQKEHQNNLLKEIYSPMRNI